MEKNDFLNILKQSLSGEISAASIETNIEYYDQYIGSRSSAEEKQIIEESGDPRLIAKTIIETERMAKGKRFSDNPGRHNEYYTPDEEASEKKSNTNYARKSFSGNVKWYYKLIIFFIIIIIISFVVIIGQVIFRILFTFGLPILIIIFLLSLFRRR